VALQLVVPSDTFTYPDGAAGEPFGVQTLTVTASVVPLLVSVCDVALMIVDVGTCIGPANAVPAVSAVPARPPASTMAAAAPVSLSKSRLLPPVRNKTSYTDDAKPPHKVAMSR
jgi:hypothetical protein